MPQSRGQHEQQPSNGQIAYITPAGWAVARASEHGTKVAMADKWANCLCHPCCMGVPNAPQRGTKSNVAHKWADSLHHRCRLGGPHRCTARGKISSGPKAGRLATPPLPFEGSPSLHNGGQISSGLQVKGKVAAL